MGNETAAVKRPTAGCRGSITGRQVVGDYTGQPAGDAAQAVRRAGLRPGLERSFGCDPSLLGLVVSQEPQAGSALARNGMVTLHVAAPGTGSGPDDVAPAPPSEAAPAPAGLDHAASDRKPGGVADITRRRRKPGLSGRAPNVFEIAPAPLPPAGPEREPQAVGDAGQEWAELVEVEPADEVDSAELSEESAEEDGFDGLTPDEFVVHVDDVFAGRTGRWRPARRAPRARGAGRDLRERLRAHPWLAGSAAFAIGLWVLLGTLGALAGQHPASGHTTGPRLIARTDHAPRTPIVRAARPLRRRTEHRTNARRQVLPTRRARATTRPARAARSRVPAAAPSAAPVQPTAAAPSVPARVSEPAPPPAEQTSGGLFSP